MIEDDETIAEQIRCKLAEVENLLGVLRDRGYDAGVRFNEKPRYDSEFWATKTATISL